MVYFASKQSCRCFGGRLHEIFLLAELYGVQATAWSMAVEIDMMFQHILADVGVSRHRTQISRPERLATLDLNLVPHRSLYVQITSNTILGKVVMMSVTAVCIPKIGFPILLPKSAVILRETVVLRIAEKIGALQFRLQDSAIWGWSRQSNAAC